MSTRRIPPHMVAGFVGMALVAVLYMAYALLLQERGRGLSAAWLLLLLLPGALAAHLCLRSGMQHVSLKEVALSGFITAHVAAGVQIAWLVIAVATTDWGHYAQQVGPEIAYAVRDLAIPATALAAGIAVVVTYAGCIGANLLGFAIYGALRAMVIK